MDSKDKIMALFKYLKELSALKYTIVTDINKQYWTCFLKDIPNDPENITVFSRDRIEDESNDNTVLLAVKKPNFHRCPEPPNLIFEWIEPGWDKFTSNPVIKDTLVNFEKTEDSANAVEHFIDSKARVGAYEKWILEWTIWSEKQHIINGTRRFFARLYQAYTDIERESETLEFMVGNGLINDLNNQNINHPVLMKRVKFDFDAKENIIRISDTDTEPELYTLMLQEMSDINYSVVKNLKDELRENFYHPLDRNDTQDFLKSLTHRLCSESKFIINENDQLDSEDKIATRCTPVYFVRRRIDGALKAIEDIITNIEKTGYVPGHLTDLVGAGKVEVPVDNHEMTIDEQLATSCGENTYILLSKEANREQLEIAERIDLYNAVLVQGPPGTGKTHTIANLLGHFLAQGKSVLVTSQTKKALSVLKYQVPDAIQNLCVSVLDDTNLDMVRSVEGISEYLSKFTSNELKRKMESSTRQRKEIIGQLAEVRQNIYTIKYREFEPIIYNGDGYSPTKAAEFVNKYAEELSYIPGKVRRYPTLPAGIDELNDLYKSNTIITLEDETELAYEIPNPELLIYPSTFSADKQNEIEYYSELDKIAQAMSLVIRCDYNNGYIVADYGSKVDILADNPQYQALEDLKEYVNSFNLIDGWMIQAAVDGHKGGGYKQKWELLIASIEDTASFAESIVTMMLGKTVLLKDNRDLSQIKAQILKLSDIFLRKGKVSKLDILFNKSIETAFSIVSINGNTIASLDDCTIIIRHLELLEKRAETEMLWNELMAKHGSPTFDALGDEPEEICKQRIPNILRYLDWYQKEFVQFRSLIDKAGFRTEVIFVNTDLDSVYVRTEKHLKSIHHIVPLYIKAAKLFIQLNTIQQRIQNTISILSEGNRKKSPVCMLTISSLQEKDTDLYEEEYRKLSQIFDKYTIQEKRVDILDKIERVAPGWAAAIAERKGIHGEAVCPDTIEQAWKWKQFAGIIDEITTEPFEELQNKAVLLSKELRTKTAELAANRAWYHLLLRTERNLDIKQALMGWKLTVKKLGKGTGKNAPVLRNQARNLMAKCQTAVPAWIMPVGKALESLDPSQNFFDVVIVDEASQSDITALAIMYLGKKVIIVGDDKQVSPMAVGLEIDRMNALREMYIKDTITNWQLYDGKTSLYDIAGTTYQPLMLREHFRCVPDIIGYSNKLSYDFKIRPLRDASNCIVVPPVVNYRVINGQREGRRKINFQEAESVVSLMIACMEQPEYERETFGVISLLGDDQAKLIQQLIFKRIEPSVIQERRILCGNASHFQGDERDVIFLSMVDSNEGDGLLRLSGEGVDQSTKQRYNVAASRAKDQLWIVHSLDYLKDLKSGDMRRDLLEYADNPQAFSRLAEIIEAKAESPFEVSVAKSLVAAGYHIIQQWEIGAYRIDMVAQYNGKKIAIECDGEKHHSTEENIRADMERQTILERMGWRFIRIRGSEYYRNPENTMKRVIYELNKYGILQESMIDSNKNATRSELLSRLKIRAIQIIEEWHQGEEDTIEDWDEGKNKLLSVFIDPHQVLLTDSKNQEEKTLLFKQNEDFAQISIDQYKTVALEKPRELALNPSNVIIHSPMPKSSDLEIVNKINADIKNAQRVFSKQGDDILKHLKLEQIDYIDKREQSGIVWVLSSSTLEEDFENILSNYGYKFCFEPRGSMSTGNKPAWRIMVI